jgi:hypothetical protein
MALMDIQSSKLEISRVLMAHVQPAAFGKAVNETKMLIYLEVRNLYTYLLRGHNVRQQSNRH